MWDEWPEYQIELEWNLGEEMTFWDLANGRETDLTPIKAPSTLGALEEPLLNIAGWTALSVGVAALVATGVAPFPSAVPIYLGLRNAYKEFGSVNTAMSELEIAKQKAAESRIRQAIKYYERSLRGKPDNPKILKLLALAYAAVGDLTAAIASLDKILVVTPADYESWLRKGTCCLALGDMLGAINAFEQAAKFGPEDPECWSNLGLVYMQLNEKGMAQQCWEKVINLNPKNISAWINRGELAYSMNHNIEGARSWKEACKIDPKLIPKWVTAYHEGNIAFSKGDLVGALARFEDAIHWDPEYSEPWIGKALCEKKSGNISLALECFNEALERDSRNLNAWFNRGNILLEMNRKAEAQSSWKEAFLIDPSVRVPWVVAFDEGSRFLAANQYHDAITHFQRAVNLLPEFPEAWFRMGMVYRVIGQADDARKCWVRVLELNPLHGLAAMNLGNLEYADDHHERALALWDQAFAADPKLVQAAINKGAALADIGELEEASKLFKIAATAGHPLGERALKLCKSYLEMDPTVGPLA